MNGNGTFVLNGQATKGMEILGKYGLCITEAKAYFTLLVLGETNAGNLSRQSGVHQSKVYWVLEKLEDKKLVATTQKFPRKVVALPFEMYLAQYIKTKQEEIDELRESRRKLREVVCKLEPVALKLNGEVQVFEPSLRRGLDSSRF